MSTKNFKRLPLGNAEFKSVRTEDYFYVDKTRYIELLEREPAKSQLFIRPRRFGKSLFLSTLSYYYDVNEAEEFEQLFGDLYIGNNPTPKRNSYAVMRFDFSGINTSCGADTFILSFCENVRNTIRQFLNKYKNIFPKTEQIIDQMNSESPGLAQLEWTFSIVQSAGVKIFVIIDEYDNFASGLIRFGFVEGNDFYTSMVKNNGLVRSFYATIKKAVQNAIVDRTFITGISPVLLDDFTSGYNIAENLSLDVKYNEMLGFTHDEVEMLKEAAGVEDQWIKINLEYYYNGYLFNKKGKNKMYNSSMILYLFNQILKTGEPPERLIDPNLGMDTGRLEPFTKNERNRNTLIKILTDGGIVSTIEEQFSLEKLNWDEESYFISLLFYMGFLTIKESCNGELRLVIPNFSIQTVYWTHLRDLITKNSPEVIISTDELKKVIATAAMEGEIQSLVDYISKNVFNKLSDFDLLHFDEKYIKVMFLCYLFLNPLYIPMSEYETVPGRSDIFLQHNPKYPEARYEWVWEFKYCKTHETELEIEAKRRDGLIQLNKYVNSHRLKDRPNLKTALIIFFGKNKYEIVM